MVIPNHSSSGIEKYRGLNSSDGGNIGDRVKIAGGVIGSGDEIEFSEELKEVLPMKLGNIDETKVNREITVVILVRDRCPRGKDNLPRYLKGQSKLGLWYPRDSPFDLEAFSDSDYTRASLDKKSTIGGCQFLGKRLISWKCKKQTIVTNSTTEAEYVAAANYCGQEENAEFGILPLQIQSLREANPAIVMARQSKSFSGKVTPLFESMLVQNQAPEGESSVTPPEPQPTPSNSQPNVLEAQTKLLQIETPPTVSHEPQTKAHIELILPSLSIFQRKQKKTQKHRRAKKGTKLPQTSVPLDLGVDEGTRSERVLKQPNEPPLLEGHTSGSGEGRMEHTFELMDIVPPIPHDSPLPGGYIPRSDEGRLKLEELMALCTKLSKHVLDLEKEKNAQAVESFDDDLDEEDATKQRRTSDKTKLMFKNSDFDDLDDLVDEGMTFVQEKDAENQGKTGANNTEAVNTADFDKDVERERQEKDSKVAIADMFDEVQARIHADYELAARMTQEEQEKYTIEERARQQKRIQDFTPMDLEKEAQKPSKRLKRVAGSYATQKSPKKSKVMKSAKDVTKERSIRSTIGTDSLVPRLIGYDVLSSSGTVYWGPWVRRIRLLGYGVLAESVLFLIFDQSIIYDVYTDVDMAYSSKSCNDLLIRQSLGYVV
ncbi:hypothetical protein Tco_1408558 [Tanacetum coccineum]